MYLKKVVNLRETSVQITAEPSLVTLYNGEYMAIVAESPEQNTPSTTYVSVGDFTARAGSTTTAINVNEAISAGQASAWATLGSELYLGYNGETRQIQSVVSGNAGACSFVVKTAFTTTPQAGAVIFTPRVEQNDALAISAGNFRARKNIYGENTNCYLFNAADLAKETLSNYKGLGTIQDMNHTNQIIDKINQLSPDFYPVSTNINTADGKFSYLDIPIFTLSSQPLSSFINSTYCKILNEDNSEFACTPTLMADMKTIKFTPTVPFVNGNVYKIWIDRNIQAVNGLTLKDWKDMDPTIQFTAQNLAPVYSAQPAVTLQTGDGWKYRYTVYDPEGVTSFTHRLKIDAGALTAITPIDIGGGVYEYTVTGQTVAEHTFQVGVSDGTTETLSDVVSVTVLGNQAPVAQSVTISGTPTVGSTLNGAYVYYDADGDAQDVAGTALRFTADDVATGDIDSDMVVAEAHVSKTIKFGATPRALTGTLQGVEALSSGLLIPVPASPAVLLTASDGKVTCSFTPNATLNTETYDAIYTLNGTDPTQSADGTVTNGTLVAGVTSPFDITATNETTVKVALRMKVNNAYSALSAVVSGTPTPKVYPSMQHLRWEFLDTVAGTSSPFTCIQEIEVNSPDILTTTGWTGYTNQGTYTIDKIADNVSSYANSYIANGITNIWAQVNLGSLQTVRNWRLKANDDNSQPKTVKVYGSNKTSPAAKSVGVDNADWTLLGTTVVLPALAGAWSNYYELA